MQRRFFLKTAVSFGAVALLSHDLLSQTPGKSVAAKKTVLAEVKGADYFADTIRSVALLGGMQQFIKPGSKVGLLVNAPKWWKRPGSYTSTEVVLATVKMAHEAGAAEIVFLLPPASDFWQRSPRSADFKDLIASVKNSAGVFIPKDIPGGISLKNAKMIKELFECDVVINLPVSKQHEGINMTGCLKNMMGACSNDTNHFFHSGGSGKKDYEDVAFLSQCIADVNLVRKPDLCIVDATEFLITNGPAGPGEIHKEQRVLASTDPVLLDARCAAFFNRRPEEILPTRLAAAHGIGSLDLAACERREEILS